MVNCYDFSVCNRTGGSCAILKEGRKKKQWRRGGGFNERALMDSQSALVEVGVA